MRFREIGIAFALNTRVVFVTGQNASHLRTVHHFCHNSTVMQTIGTGLTPSCRQGYWSRYLGCKIVRCSIFIPANKCVAYILICGQTINMCCVDIEAVPVVRCRPRRKALVLLHIAQQVLVEGVPCSVIICQRDILCQTIISWLNTLFILFTVSGICVRRVDIIQACRVIAKALYMLKTVERNVTVVVIVIGICLRIHRHIRIAHIHFNVVSVRVILADSRSVREPEVG